MTDWQGTIAIGAAVTGVTSYTVATVLMWRRRKPGELPAKSAPWRVEPGKGGTYSVVTVEAVPALGIAAERTSYDGYEHWQAVAVANWLNDESDVRPLDQMLLDETAKREAEAKAREDRRRRGGDPVYELGRAEPVDYIEPFIVINPPARVDGFTPEMFARMLDAKDRAAHDIATYSQWTRERLQALVRQRHHLTLHQMGVLTRTDLLKILAFDEPLPAPSANDIHTEYDLRQALAVWRESVKANAPGERWSVEQREQLRFLEQRASTLGLKHVLLSVMHADPVTFDEPWTGIPTSREWR